MVPLCVCVGQATSAVIAERSRILELLQEEKEQATQKLEEFRSRRNHLARGPPHSPTPGTGSSLEATSSELLQYLLTPSQPITTKVPYANYFDPDEMPSNSASHLDPSFLTC